MATQKLTKTAMAKKMRTSRTALNPLLDENDTSLTPTTLASGAVALGRQVRFDLCQTRSLRSRCRYFSNSAHRP